ncbi:MAG: hypothetical protein A2Z71_01980 [Chloroflexi bacterium RBG_13_50_21]|nr:MAG: hypothetical protein A2Z71_01980 [Chloroflexi bacterium RBG_13_50_21]
MKKMVSILMIVLLVSILFTSTAFASENPPTGSCAKGFELHPFMEHNGEHTHMHIGIDQDLNGDGYICMKIVTPELHLHLDNSLPLK